MAKAKTKEIIIALIAEGIAHVGAAWSKCGEAAHEVVVHCNEFNHSPDLVKTMYSELAKSDANTIRDAFKKAVWMCCALTIKVEKGDVTTDFDREQWAKIVADNFSSITVLREKGLKEFKPVRAASGAKKPGVTAASIYEVMAADLTKAMVQWRDQEPNSPKLKAFQDKLEALKVEVVESFNSFKDAQKILVSKTLLKEKEPVVAELPAPTADSSEAERKAWLKAELAKLDSAA